MSIDHDDDAIQEFHLDAIADADPYPYWYDDVDEPDSNPTLVRTESCDLLVIGGGYNGLWTAIIAKERDPSRDVVLIEAHEVGSQASGRNGGFMESSLTHGIANAQQRFPQEIDELEDLGIRNLNEIEAAIRRYNIDCDFERTGVIDVATTAHPGTYVDEMREDFLQLRSLGQNVEWLDREAMHKQIHSPTYLGGLWRKDRAAIVDPARLVWGLKRVAESLGVHIYEDTKATNIERDGVGVLVETALGRVRAGWLADLIVVDGNPLEDIKVLYAGGTTGLKNGKEIRTNGSEWVIKDGIPYSGPQLLREVKAIVDKAKAAEKK